eukprot:TRINITY_DN209100_c0_g1_i1.p1 TRINITY_DN209100_c0_g1~~TRINITY_DN209100_c0_g1_i1.p1  ORF type:complete len:193 (+),score=32.50 TRINITY_DN209100_c0_g1_i1:133-711(+)
MSCMHRILHNDAVIWRSSLALSDLILSPKGKRLLENKRVLELGCGEGTLTNGANCRHVTITDGIPETVNRLREIFMKGKDTNMAIELLKWGDLSDHSKEICERKFDVVVGADVFFAKQWYEDLLCTCKMVAATNPKAMFIFAYEQRELESIAPLLKKWRFEASRISLRDYLEEDLCDEYDNIEIFCLNSVLA